MLKVALEAMEITVKMFESQPQPWYNPIKALYRCMLSKSDM